MFRLQRYFTITSFIAFILIAILLGYFYRTLAFADLIATNESKNVALTQTFSNSLWPDFAPFVAEAGSMTAEELQAHPRTQELYEQVQTQMEGLSVVKVKVYNLEGLTAFSSERAQIGQDKSDNAGYLSARAGLVASELTFRDSFSAFEQTIEDRNVFSSYVPIYGSSGNIEGVFEVYDDVTPLVQRLEQTQRNIILGVAGILAVLYLVLFIIVRRADHIIRQQYQELAQSEVALRQARDEALTASQFKTKLLGNVSHDMRTPLNAIMGYTEMLQEGVYGELTPRQHQAAGEIIGGTGQLLNFVNNLLDQAQLETGRVKLNSKPFAPAALVEDVHSLLDILAKAKGLAFTSDVSPELPDSILGDRYWLRQIVVNLVSNALKFTQEGTVHLHVFRYDETHWAFQVTDTGIGIPQQTQAKVFEAFERGDISANGTYLGSGLGLSIVKELVTLMAGDIELTSVEGNGSTFTVVLPLETAEEVRA
jgi:signal transduction histidine kinase